MTDEEVYDKLNKIWIECCSSELDKFLGKIKTNDLIQLTRYFHSYEGELSKTLLDECHDELNLRTDIPRKMKLEVVLLCGD